MIISMTWGKSVSSSMPFSCFHPKQCHNVSVFIGMSWQKNWNSRRAGKAVHSVVWKVNREIRVFSDRHGPLCGDGTDLWRRVAFLLLSAVWCVA